MKCTKQTDEQTKGSGKYFTSEWKMNSFHSVHCKIPRIQCWSFEETLTAEDIFILFHFHFSERKTEESDWLLISETCVTDRQLRNKVFSLKYLVPRWHVGTIKVFQRMLPPSPSWYSGWEQEAEILSQLNSPPKGSSPCSFWCLSF